MRGINRLTQFTMLLLILSSNAYGQKPTPPPEAYKACEGKKVGDAAEIAGPRGNKVKGICNDVDGKLVLQPDRTQGKKNAGPPPEAIKACEGKNAGDAAEIAGPRGNTVKGICNDVDGKLVLQPDRTQVKKNTGPPPEAIKACEGKIAGDSAEFAGSRGETVKGICKDVDGKLVLQPDRPKAK